MDFFVATILLCMNLYCFCRWTNSWGTIPPKWYDSSLLFTRFYTPPWTRFWSWWTRATDKQLYLTVSRAPGNDAGSVVMTLWYFDSQHPNYVLTKHHSKNGVCSVRLFYIQIGLASLELMYMLSHKYSGNQPCLSTKMLFVKETFPVF